ncbi:Hypothetical protein DEACI_3073 [Acididesulfobacillus acetoxydans]|uniref:Uncharacterized protein n=1 Tax=Acididesulfobacillus acetoxydans TaxID=1561005 RepID=A0A8S0W982_9FIRM|nr:Hypothetical protein DEACI_3073 [Acididesulfobacillus acetoxydans]CEJ08366.1 Hypothetical protein DEACI_2842 [Acididesulfobacillus acetoxydans]
MEHLKIKNMMRNYRFAQSIQDAGANVIGSEVSGLQCIVWRI